MTNSIPELADSACILVTGSNTMEAHPLVASYILRAAERGAKVIVVDPREVPMARLAHIHLQPKPGTDIAWLNGLMHVIVAEGLADEAFIAERTEGFEAQAAALERYTPEYVEQVSGIPAQDLRTAARTYAQSGRSSIVYAMGITQHINGTDNVLACANLAMLTGNVGKPGTGVNPLRGQNNVQGACDVGCLVNVYPGYQSVTNESVRNKFEQAWGRTSGPAVGLTLTKMMDRAIQGDLRGMYIMGENPVLSDPDSGHVRLGLQAVEFLAVSDIFMSETAELADVVLPAASWVEKDGTFTATDRRVQRFRRAIAPLGDSRPDWWIVAELAKRMRFELGVASEAPYAGWEYAGPEQVATELCALTPIYGGITWERLDRPGGLQWPCPSANHPGVPYLHKGQFPLGRGRFSVVHHQPAAELTDAEYPLVLTTGRMAFHWHTGTMTRRTEKLHREAPDGYAEVNPVDAERLGIVKSGRVRLISRRGQIEARAWITRRVPEGVVFVPFHFAESAANTLTNGALDPKSGIPEFKVCAVRLEPAGTSPAQEA
jgi:formate dehydrogenase alpha subunit